jgi:hypothetical protein
LLDNNAAIKRTLLDNNAAIKRFLLDNNAATKRIFLISSAFYAPDRRMLIAYGIIVSNHCRNSYQSYQKFPIRRFPIAQSYRLYEKYKCGTINTLLF